MLDAGFCNLKQTRGHEPEFELAVLSPRRTVVRYASGGCSLSGDPPGRATSICAAVRGAPLGAPYHLFTRCAFRGRAGSFEPVHPCHGVEAPAFAGALRTSTEPATVSPRSARFRVFEARSRTTRNDFMTSDVGRGLRAKDPSAPTPQGSGARRVPLLARRPRAPSVIAPGAYVAGEPRASWRCEPGATEILVRAAPREGGGVPEDQSAWNRFVSRCRGRVTPSCRSTGLRPTPPLAGCCRCGEPALGPPSRPASR